jgi:hypothetical protein
MPKVTRRTVLEYVLVLFRTSLGFNPKRTEIHILSYTHDLGYILFTVCGYRYEFTNHQTMERKLTLMEPDVQTNYEAKF